MPDSFDLSIAAGEERGRRLAELDVAAAAFQARFLGLCGEFLARMEAMDSGSRAFFDLYGTAGGGGQVSVFEGGRVTLHRHGTSIELSGPPTAFARAILGSYETAYPDAAALEAEADRTMESAEQTMALVLGERAALRSRMRAGEAAAD